MRDPARIDPFIAELRSLWHECPDWRFGQLVTNMTPETLRLTAGGIEISNVEDGVMGTSLTELRERLSGPKIRFMLEAQRCYDATAWHPSVHVAAQGTLLGHFLREAGLRRVDPQPLRETHHYAAVMDRNSLARFTMGDWFGYTDDETDDEYRYRLALLEWL